MTTSDTIRPMPRPRGVLSVQTITELGKVRNALSDAERRYRLRVVRALEEGSFTAVAEATGLSKDTLQRWKREAGK
jgi:DNA invertase Pin-like site-specific DNA recombinase